MKKLFPGILALLLTFGCFAGCGDKKTDSSSPADSTPPASAPGDSSTDDSTPDEESPLYALNAVKEVLNGAMIKKNVEMRKDYTVANQWYSWHADETFEITWTVTDAEGNATTNVTIEEGDGEFDTVKVNSNLEEDFTYILKGTINDSKNQSVEISFTRKVLKAGEYLPVAITEKPVEDVVYNLHVYQSTLGKDLFFNGDDKAATYYFGTTEDYMEAVDVGVEYIENSDAFNVFFTDANGAKKYIGVQLSEDGAHDNIKATDAPVSSFIWNAELGTILTHLEVNKNGEASDYYLGNYSDKTTISCSMVSYAGGAGNNVGGLVTMVHKDEIPVTDASKVTEEKGKLAMKSAVLGVGSIELPAVGVTYSDVTITWTEDSDYASIENGVLTTTAVTKATSFTLTATIKSGNVSETKEFTIALNPDVETISTPVADTAYNMVIKQYTRGEAIYVDGTFGERYLNTTTNVADAAKVYVETVSDGIKVYIMVENVKNYLNVYNNNASKLSVNFAAEGCVFSYNADKNAWCTTLGETEYYVGNYSDFNTVSASKSSYINAENTGVSQFPLEFVAVTEGGEEEGGETLNSYPVAGKAYNLEAICGSGTIYFAGTVGGSYKLETTGRIDGTTNKANATAIYFEAAATAGEYYIYFMNGETKVYIDGSGTSTSGFKFTTTKPTDTWVVDLAKKAICSKATGRFMGTQSESTYTNISTYAASNIGGTSNYGAYANAWFVAV